MAKQPVNRLHKPKKSISVITKQIAKKLPFLLLIMVIVTAGYHLHRSNIFEPEINWTIDEKLNKSDFYYEQIVAPLLNNKYLINLAELKEMIEVEAWVSSAQIKRIFWNKIDVNIDAHVIAMRWQSEGYISTNGVIFKPITLEESAKPLAVVAEHKIPQYFKDYQLYRRILDPLVITTFKRDQIDKITIKPNVNIILGNIKQDQRLKDFVKAYNNLKKTSRKIRKRGIFDMRYAKGFALSFQKQ